MTSPKSLQNNFGFAYRSGLRDHSLFAILNTVFLSFFFVLTPIMSFSENTQTDRETGVVSVINFKEKFSFLFTGAMEYMRYFVIIGLLGIGLLVGLSVFKFITGKKTVNVYYSLGIKRAKLFTAKYLSGLTLIALSVLLPMLVSLLINIAKLGTNKFMIPAFFYLTIGMFSVAAFSYTLTAFVCTLVGTIFEGALFSGILLLFPEIFFTCLNALIRVLVFGTPLGTEFASSNIYMGESTAQKLTTTFANYNPLRYLSEGLFTYSLADAKGQVVSYDNGSAVAWSAPNFLPILLWLAAAAALFVGGMFCYKRRKAEIGGFIGKNRVLNFIGTFLVGIFGFVLIFDLLRNKGMAVSIAVGVIGFTVIYAILNLLLLRNLRQFVKELPALPIQLAIVAVILVFFATGYFGAANKIPEAADIASAQITMPVANYTTATNSGGSRYMLGLPAANTMPYGEYTSEKDIQFVRGIHEKLVAAGKAEPSKLNTDFNGTYPISVKIVYKLKNGKEVLRCYYGISEELLKELQKSDATDYQQSVYKKIFKDELKVVEAPKAITEVIPAAAYQAYNEYLFIRAVRESEDIRLYNKTLSTETPMELTAQQHAALLDCLYKDLTAQKTESHYNPSETLGMIRFADAQQETDTMSGGSMMITEDNEVISDPKYDASEDGFSGTSLQRGRPDFLITADMTNTVEFLKSVGYYDAMAGNKAIRSVYGIQVAQLFNRSYLDDWIYYHDDFSCEYLAESSTQDRFGEITGDYEGIAAEDKPNIYNTADKATVQAVYDGAVTRSILSPEDYIVVFVYEDGMRAKAYVRAEKMPEEAKTGIAKNKPAESFYW